MPHGVLRGAFVGFGNVAAEGHLPGWRLRKDIAIVAATDVGSYWLTAWINAGRPQLPQQ